MSVGLKMPDTGLWTADGGGSNTGSPGSSSGSDFASGLKSMTGALGSASKVMSGAAGMLGSASPWGAVAGAVSGVAQAALNPDQLTGTAKGGDVVFGSFGDQVFNWGSGSQSFDKKDTTGKTESTTGRGQDMNVWLIGGLVLAGLVALKMTRG